MKTLQWIQTSKLQGTNDSVSLVTKDNWQGFCKHVKHRGNEYWETERLSQQQYDVAQS